jgi:hypothetical protein
MPAERLYSLDGSFDNSIETFGTEVSVQLLTEIDTVTLAGKRTPKSYTVQFANQIDEDSSQITFASMPAGLIKIPKGSSLVYEAGNVDHLVKIYDDIVADSLTADTSVFPVDFPATTDFKLYPFHTLLGGSTIDLKLNDKEVETRGFESNIWSDAKKVMVGGAASWSGFYPRDDEAFTNVILPAATSSQEVFLEIKYSNGMIRYGSAYIQGYGENGNNDDTVKASWTFRFVTEIFFRNAQGVLL